MATVIGKADVVQAMRDVNMRVQLKRVHEHSLRLWVGVRLMRLAARIMNCNMKIEVESRL